MATLISSILMLVIGCSPHADAGARHTSEAATERAITGQFNGDIPDPCHILTREFLEEFFEIQGELTRNPSRHSPHPYCMVTWRKADADAIEEKNKAMMMQYIQDKAAGKDVTLPNERTDNIVSLTINSPLFDTESEASNGFETVKKILSEGKSVEVKGKIYNSGAREIISISGVGNKAIWTPSLHQVSVQSGKAIFHVTVEAGKDAASRELAERIAIKLIRNVAAFHMG